MPKYAYDRLSAQDNNFLLWRARQRAHRIASTLVCDAGPLQPSATAASTSIYVQARHRVVPAPRAALSAAPARDPVLRPRGVGQTIRTSTSTITSATLRCPNPAATSSSRSSSARIMAQPLDRKRPLWETWIVEGLEGDRFAMITKIHHCMIDGASGVDLAYIQMSPTPEVRELGTPPAFHRARAPSRFELWRARGDAPMGIPFEIVARPCASSPPTPGASGTGARDAREGARLNMLGMVARRRKRHADGAGARRPTPGWLTCPGQSGGVSSAHQHGHRRLRYATAQAAFPPRTTVIDRLFAVRLPEVTSSIDICASHQRSER